MKRDRKDMDGNNITLKHLCEQEPKWAESKVLELEDLVKLKVHICGIANHELSVCNKDITDLEAQVAEFGRYKKATDYHGLVLMVESNGRCSFFNESKFNERMQKNIYRAISEAIDLEIKNKDLEAQLAKHEKQYRDMLKPWIERVERRDATIAEFKAQLAESRKAYKGIEESHLKERTYLKRVVEVLATKCEELDINHPLYESDAKYWTEWAEEQATEATT